MAKMLEIPKQEAMTLLNTLTVTWIEDNIESIKEEAIGLIEILLVYKKRGYLSNDEIVKIVEELREVSF